MLVSVHNGGEETTWRCCSSTLRLAVYRSSSSLPCCLGRTESWPPCLGPCMYVMGLSAVVRQMGTRRHTKVDERAARFQYAAARSARAWWRTKQGQGAAETLKKDLVVVQACLMGAGPSMRQQDRVRHGGSGSDLNSAMVAMGASKGCRFPAITTN